jgi:hypothetical protein
MKTFKSLITSMYSGRVDWLVIEHLSAQGRPIKGRAPLFLDVQIKLEPFLLAH